MRPLFRCARGILFAATLALLAAGCDQGNRQDRRPGSAHEHGGTHGHGAAAVQKPPVAQKICPVMDRPINQDIYVDHNGRRVYFCCQTCVDLFKKNPEKYLKKLDQQLQAQRK